MLHGGANYSELIEILRLLREIGPEAKELVTLDEPKRNRADLPEFIRDAQNHVTAVAFTHDGKFLATLLLDGTVRLRGAP